MYTPSKLVQPQIIEFSQNHKNSLKKSKALQKSVEAFLNDNFKQTDGRIDMQESNDSLGNSKQFFQGELKMLIAMTEHLKRLYTEKQRENLELRKMNDQYKKKLHKVSKKEQKQTVHRNKEVLRNSLANEYDEKITKKKEEISNEDVFMVTEKLISQFQFDNKKSNKFSEKKEKLISGKMRKYQSQEASQKSEVQSIQSKDLFQFQDLQEIQLIKNQNKKIKKIFKKTYENAKILASEKESIQLQNNILLTKYQTLEKQYLELENKLGEISTEYEIKSRNYRQLIKKVKIYKKPEEYKSYEEGYHSIYRKKILEQDNENSSSESNLSFQSQNQIESNYKEQNIFLRNKLIEALDKNGELTTKLSKQEKLIQNLQESRKQKQNSKQNNQNLSNISENLFKKNKKASILFVDNTVEMQNDTNQQKKISKLLSQASNLFEQQLNGKRLSNFDKISFLIQKIKHYQQSNLDNQRQLYLRNEQKEKLKDQFDKLSKKYEIEVQNTRKMLLNIHDNVSQTKSIDIPDKAFRKIELNENEHLNHNYLGYFGSQHQDYLQKIDQQQKQIEQLKQKIKQFEYLPNMILKNNLREGSIIAKNKYLPQMSQNLIEGDYNNQLELSYFEMFRQKLTQFYQNVNRQISELQYCASGQQIDTYEQQQKFTWVLKKSFMKISNELESLKSHSFIDSQFDQKDEENQFFKEKRLSSSFVGEQNLTNLINKKMQQFQQYSSELINQHFSDMQNSTEDNQFSVFNLSNNVVFNEDLFNLQSVKSSGIQQNEDDLINDINAKSQSVSSSDLQRQRQALIKEQIHHYIKTDRPRYQKQRESSNEKSCTSEYY